VIDFDIFAQILELDEDGDASREFSREMAWAYFDQATSTLEQMDDAL
jgi:hypothetical protein